MPEEVTYATLKFPNLKTKQLQESSNVKRTDHHGVPELEMDGAAENGTESAESTVEVAGSRAGRGPTASWKVWGPVAFILLTLNLVVLAGLGTLVLLNYQELISNRTANGRQQSMREQLEKNITLYMDIYKNVSSEHIILKNMFENTLKVLNNFTSKYYEDLKQKENDLTFCSCSVSYICHGDSKKDHSSMNMDKRENENGTQLFIKCLPSPISWMDLNCTLNKTNKTAKNVSEFCILTRLAP